MDYRLPLADPLWQRLDDAHRDRDIPALLARLAEAWDAEAADSLFWDCLCHQETLYGATYAAAPWLLEIGEWAADASTRCDIAVFLGFVAMVAQRGDRDALPGLPDTEAEWEAKLAPFRSLSARRPRSAFEAGEQTRYLEILQRGPVLASDLDTIRLIGLAFRDLLPRIGGFCEACLAEAASLPDTSVLVGGVAAAQGMVRFAQLLFASGSGWVECPACAEAYEYLAFDEGVFLYSDSALEDFKDGHPSRHRARFAPLAPEDPIPPQERAVFEVVGRLPPGPARSRVLALMGSVRCPSCAVLWRPGNPSLKTEPAR